MVCENLVFFSGGCVFSTGRGVFCLGSWGTPWRAGWLSGAICEKVFAIFRNGAAVNVGLAFIAQRAFFRDLFIRFDAGFGSPRPSFSIPISFTFSGLKKRKQAGHFFAALGPVFTAGRNVGNRPLPKKTRSTPYAAWPTRKFIGPTCAAFSPSERDLGTAQLPSAGGDFSLIFKSFGPFRQNLDRPRP